MSRPPTPVHHYDPYERLAPFYDAMSSAMLLPFGGERRFRARALDALEIRPGTRVLELGCGTGSNTRALLAWGARVTGLDLSAPMLARARRRAPGATLLEHDLLDHGFDATFDRVLLSFVLHEMEAPIRSRALAAARRALVPGGLVGILDFARPPAAPVRWGLGAYLRVAEPPTAREWVAGGFERELGVAGLVPIRAVSLALGTARFVVAR